ncbi:transcription-repair coupling factor [Psychrobium sp. 1_MG-2023]|uniref:transcription-repair coupling factor n=1 Tax=Psychrobium sp. 1_MG-2023 TaxID=3062624 RepID=UPI000C32FE1E|nr:transcription-repair coupling factor [Psychrobium sp. 1_MG-2023]MDP2560289.1 transcription-repair coupling factor [Psychrobium sp. 1_MG-2023]PKF55406.1 transcription-repair coupling factor [Alteromonadales bacterium alter-6D02]
MPLSTQLLNTIPSLSDNNITLANLRGSALPLAMIEAAQQHDGLNVLICSDTSTALKLETELSFLGQEHGLPVLLFPDWETLPYDNFSPHQDIISQRLETLYRLPSMTNGILIVPIATTMAKLAPKQYLQGNTILLSVDQQHDAAQFKSQLEMAGYQNVHQVLAHGEYSQRGSILDIYPMGSNQPYRIDYIDDEIDSIAFFDPETQRSKDKVSQIRILPAHEFPTTKLAIEQFRSNWRDKFSASNEAESIYQQVSKRVLPAGIEYYLPLFFAACDSLFDYLPQNTQLLSVGDIHQSANEYWNDVAARYEERRYDRQRPILAPEDLFNRVEQTFSQLKTFHRIDFTQQPVEEKAGKFNINAHDITGIAVNHQLDHPTADLLQYLTQHQDHQIIFCVESLGRSQALLELLAKDKIKPIVCDSFIHAIKQKLAIVVSPLENSVKLPTLALSLICESELFGIQVSQRRRREKAQTISSEAIVRSLAELSIGQPVVHYDHGVGRYQGLTYIENGGINVEYVTLEYASEAKLYVPVSSLNLISRYSGASEDSAPLHHLGSDKWTKAKRKAAEKVRDVAAELLDIYAQRAAKKGYKFNLNHDEYNQFSAGFPFEETVDQQNAILHVVNDMQKPTAMDRLVCGDVGFGKTEVAMRAAFVAVNDAKQVAILVPTTLLAQQHFENFRDRFANTAIKVEQLSRFRSAKQQQQTIDELADGKIDIIIGTHKLIQGDIKFADLGLLIVDEEHRFGVRQKEKIKALRADIDILTMTATPIPRTLNMAMSGMRDLSIIATPPSRRLSVNTFVREYDEAIVKEAVRREIMRGGQVYFLHNDVDKIEDMAQDLEQLLPEARIGIAHGQMRERELEKVMSDFYHQRYNVLLCSTIIETGIDIPSANTIIINRADKFGLAQLHQLRGRVGRSHHQAYAYLLTPNQKNLSKDAIKRLEAIESLTDLGAGFVLATHDLEIRGAGELLGDDQSGQIQTIGFSLYMEMLDGATNALKNGETPALDNLLPQGGDVDLKIAALLPDDYIFDVNTRLSLYKRVANCRNQKQLDALQVELIDRFGLLPDAAKNLFVITRIKQRICALGIDRLEAGINGGQIVFSNRSKVDLGYLLTLLQQQPSIYKLDGSNKLKFLIKTDTPADRLSLVNAMLDEFEKHQTEN